MNHPELPWLARPTTIRLLWWLFAFFLAISVVAQFFIPGHPHFKADGWFGFHAVFGFLACGAMVLVAKLLGYLLKRPENYYDHD